MSIFYPRQLEKTLNPWLKKPEGILIAGARQTGKTTLLKKLQKNCQKSIFLSLEDRQTLAKIQQNPQDFLSSIVKNGYKNIFIDEFQKIPDITSAVKFLYDHSSPKPKFYLSGSVSDFIYKKEGDSMVGRVMRFQLFTLSFREFLKAKKIKLEPLNTTAKALEKLLNFSSFETKKLEFSLLQETGVIQNLFEQYMLLGGYPATLNLSRQETPLLFENIQSSFWEKDLLGFLKRNQLAPLQQLVVILAKRTASPLSLQNLANDLQIDPKTVLNLIHLLKYSFWIDIVYPKASFGGEYKRKFKVYFLDNGLRNYLAQTTSLLSFESGPALENAIFGILQRFIACKNYFCHLNYWQTYSGGEVDFVLEKDGKLIAIEVKSESLKREKISRGIVSFIKKYKPATAIQINRNFFGQKKIGSTTVFFLPAYCFALLV